MMVKKQKKARVLGEVQAMIMVGEARHGFSRLRPYRLRIMCWVDYQQLLRTRHLATLLLQQ